MVNFVARQFQKSSEQVAEQKRAKIADVREVINGWPTAVHPHQARLDGLKFFKLVRQRIVKLDFHCRCSTKIVEQSGRNLAQEGLPNLLVGRLE